MPILQKSIPEVSNAPTVDFIPIRTKWTQNGIVDFSMKVSPILNQLVANYTISSSKALFDIFFQSINKTLIAYATATNKSISLPPPKPPKCRQLAQIRKNLKICRSTPRKKKKKQDI